MFDGSGMIRKFKRRPLLSEGEKQTNTVKERKKELSPFLPEDASSRSVPSYEGMDVRDKRAVDKSVRKRTKHYSRTPPPSLLILLRTHSKADFLVSDLSPGSTL